ncbi:MAG: hypothetical protein MZU91_08875 [Desulfosudis oleivorans]|nr:hypothetical protein [Desulfosudis oleivorans]
MNISDRIFVRREKSLILLSKKFDFFHAGSGCNLFSQVPAETIAASSRTFQVFYTGSFSQRYNLTTHHDLIGCAGFLLNRNIPGSPARNNNTYASPGYVVSAHMVTKRNGLVVAGLVIIAWVLVAMAEAAVMTVNNGANAIQTAIAAAERECGLGKHLILCGQLLRAAISRSPKPYLPHGLAYAHGLAGTIINATRSGTD